MIKALSSKLVVWWKNTGVILDDADNMEIYSYGLELFFSSILNLFFLLVISVLMGTPFAFVPYLLGFVPIRIMAGGYHANAHWSCITIFSITYTLALLAMRCQANSVAPISCVVISTISLLVTWIFSPVQAKNKPLPPEDVMTYRKISLTLCVLFSAIAVRQIIFPTDITLSVKLFFCGEGIAALSLIAAKLISN